MCPIQRHTSVLLLKEYKVKTALCKIIDQERCAPIIAESLATQLACSLNLAFDMLRMITARFFYEA